jgi:hypothetical protein
MGAFEKRFSEAQSIDLPTRTGPAQGAGKMFTEGARQLPNEAGRGTRPAVFF